MDLRCRLCTDRFGGSKRGVASVGAADGENPQGCSWTFRLMHDRFVMHAAKQPCAFAVNTWSMKKQTFLP
eukprot:1156229-Pelagomonas_calceolata.AAC.12